MKLWFGGEKLQSLNKTWENCFIDLKQTRGFSDFYIFAAYCGEDDGCAPTSTSNKYINDNESNNRKWVQLIQQLLSYFFWTVTEILKVSWLKIMTKTKKNHTYLFDSRKQI